MTYNIDQLPERFRDKITQVPFCDCWIWTGSISPDGYGRVAVNQKNKQAYREVYKLMVGEIPEGKCLDHLCRVRSCVNPAHLEPCSNIENIVRGKLSRGTCKRGHPMSGDNMRITKFKHYEFRVCKACQKINLKNYHEKKKNEVSIGCI